jgi:hypothetical protein
MVSIPVFGYLIFEDGSADATLATGLGALGPTSTSLATCTTGRSFPLDDTPGVVRADLSADFTGGDNEFLGFAGFVPAKNLAVPVRCNAAAMSWGCVMVVNVYRAESIVCIRLL